MRSMFRAALVVLVAASMLSTATSSALAAPKGIFSVFSNCPVSVPGVALCQYGQITGGELSIGNTKVPVNKTITLQGGALPTGELNRYYILPATNGESLSKVELEVPGGLLGSGRCGKAASDDRRGWLDRLRQGLCGRRGDNRLTAVTVTTEVVANEKDPAFLDVAAFVFEEGAAFVLPTRLHLKNPLLGNNCYIGSEANPIRLQLTTGTTSPPPPNTPIKGKAGSAKEEEENSHALLATTEVALVDNSFSVPVAEGCGGALSFLVDPMLDHKFGLPSAAGHNTLILEGGFKLADTTEVIASEQ